MENRTVLPLTIAGLMIIIGTIYLVSAYREPIEAAEEAASTEEEVGGSADSGGNGGTSTTDNNGGLDLGTELQTAFFAIAGLGNLGVAAWILVSRKKIIKPPYVAATAGSAFMIVFYIISRTVALPIVGIQSDIGNIDIICKVLQAAVVGLSVYVISVTRSMGKEIRVE
jgi:hypothetical protein